MPGRYTPPDFAGIDDINDIDHTAGIAQLQDTEQMKRPKKRATGARRSKSLQHLQPPEITASASPPPKPAARSSPPTVSTAAASPPLSASSSDPPEPLNTQALSLPSTSLSNTSDTADTAPTPSTPRANVPDPPSTSPAARVNNPPKPGAEASPPGGVITVGGIDFHHASEAEFARLLNYYGIEWQYEPRQFALQWRDGRPIEMFTPDFYLTEYDLYIELTTMRQSLVRRKNRKMRLLRALYPEINVKLIYRRDYQRLLQRFGIRPEEIEAETPLAHIRDDYEDV